MNIIRWGRKKDLKHFIAKTQNERRIRHVASVAAPSTQAEFKPQGVPRGVNRQFEQNP
jgi:hypothetical protein